MAEDRRGLECPRCGSRDVVNINLSLEHGDRVAFFSCHQCDKRWWHKDGAPVDLPDVLEMARRPGRAQRGSQESTAGNG